MPQPGPSAPSRAASSGVALLFIAAVPAVASSMVPGAASGRAAGGTALIAVTLGVGASRSRRIDADAGAHSLPGSER